MRPLRAALALVMGLAGVAIASPAANAIDDGDTVNLAIAVPLAAPARANGLITAAELEAYTRPLGELTRQLDAVIGRPVAIAIDPMLIVSIRVLGTSAPASATAWLHRLESASNETFALPYADTDVTLATQAGNARVLDPQSFDFAIDPTLFAEPIEPGTEATATPTPAPTEPPDEVGAPTLPTSEELTAWPYTLESLGWPRANTVTTNDLPALSASWDSVILSSGNVARTGTASVVSLDGLSALISDDAVSAALDTTVTAVTAGDWATAFTALDAALSATARVQPGTATVLATLGRGLLADGTRVAETIDTLASTPGVVLVPLSTVAAQSPAGATVVDEPQDADRVAVVRGMLAATSAEQGFSSIVADPGTITAPRRLQLLALTSTSWLANPTGWATATSAFLTESSDLLASVQVVDSSNFNLLADNATLPISVSNSLDQAITVYISVRPETAILAVGQDRVELTVKANSQGKGQVPVQAISNGTVHALVTLSSSTGVAVGLPTTAAIEVRAGWETPIVVILAAAVVAIFGIGIVRNILRRRTPATTAPESDD